MTGPASLSDLAKIDAATSLTITYGTITDTAVNLSNDGVYVNGTHPVTVTGTAPTVAQLGSISGKTDGVVTASVSGTAAELASLTTANTDSITVTVSDASLTGSSGVTALNTLGGKTAGVVTATISGTAAELAALTTASTDAITVTVTDPASLSDLAKIDAATSLTITYGTITDTAVNLSNDSVYVNGTHPATVTGTAPTVAQLGSISGKTDGVVTASVSGTAAELASLTTANTDSITVTVSDSSLTGSSGVTALNTLGGKTAGVVTATISGTAAELAALTTASTDAITVTVTDPVSLSDLAKIDAATSLTITYGTITDTAANLSNDSVYVNGTHPVTVTGTAPTVSELGIISGKTAGVVTASISGTAAELASLTTANTDAITVTVSDSSLTGSSGVTALNTLGGKTAGVVTATISGTAAELAALTTASTDAITVTINGSTTIAQLRSIDNATSGAITYATFEDSSANLAAESVPGGYLTVAGSKAVTLTDDHSLTQLIAINAATSGTITMFNNGIGLTGSAANLAAALNGITGYQGVISITDNHNLERLKTINNATSATITLINKAIDLSGSAADVAAALAGITDYTGNVDINTVHNLSQLKAINNATSGSITLQYPLTELEGEASELAAALTGITYTGPIIVTGVVSLAQLATIDGATSNSVTSGTITDTAANLAANTDGYLSGNKSVTITTNHTLAQLKAINNATTGAITLASKAIDLTGSAADLADALDGITDYTGNITITGSASIDQLSAIDTAAQNAITYSSVTDTASKLAANVGGYVNFNKTVTLTTNHSLAELKAINNATAGAITLASNAVALSGSADDLAVALSGFTDYTGNVTVTTSTSIETLKSIDAATTGSITLDNSSLLTPPPPLGNLSTTVATAVRSAQNKVDYTYAIVDTTANVNAASVDVLKSATAITSNDNAATTGSTLNLYGVNAHVNAIGVITIPSVAITGDSGANIVQLSAALTHSDQVVASFGGADSTTDTLIFNVVDGDYTTWSSDPSTVTQGSNTLGFNKLSGFSFVNPSSGNAEDRLGIFTTDRNIFGRFVSTSSSSGAALQLRDGTVFEDDDLGLIDDSKDASLVRDRIAQFIADGGAVAPGTSIGKSGQSVNDFIYVAYGESSADSSKTSAYVYAGYFDKGSSGAFAATGGVVTDAIKSKISIVSLAEILDISVGDLASGNFTSSKPAGLS